MKMPRTKEDRIFFLNLKICPICRRNRLYYGEKSCLECKAKKNEYNHRHYLEYRDVITERQNKKHRELYAERKTQGLCVTCGKRKAVYGKVRCHMCLYKNAKANQIKRLKKEGGVLHG